MSYVSIVFAEEDTRKVLPSLPPHFAALPYLPCQTKAPVKAKSPLF